MYNLGPAQTLQQWKMVMIIFPLLQGLGRPLIYNINWPMHKSFTIPPSCHPLTRSKRFAKKLEVLGQKVKQTWRD